MIDPYQVLELEPIGRDAEIRRRYLEMVRRYPPDREPERFAAVREAYDQLRDPVVRLKSKLFPEHDCRDSMDSILADVKRRLRTARIPLKVLLSMVEQ